MRMDKDVKENITLQISGQQKMINSKEVEILGTKIDQKLLFHKHIKSISKKAGQKLRALLRISHTLKIKKRKLFITKWSNPNLITVRQSRCSVLENQTTW